MSNIKSNGTCRSRTQGTRPCQLQASVREAEGNRLLLGLEDAAGSKADCGRMEICLTPQQSMRLGHKLLQVGKSLKERSIREGQRLVQAATATR